MRKKLIFVLVTVFLLQALFPVAFAVSKDEVTASTPAVCIFDTSLKGAGKGLKSGDISFGQSSVDKAFGKHSGDFGNYADGSKASVNQFTNDLRNLADTGIQKSGIYRDTAGTHIFNSSTQQWMFVNSDGSFNTAFKLSPDQFNYLTQTGVVKV
jgi:hypothetical protein